MSTIVFSEAFPQANGSAWDAAKWTVLVGGATTNDVQSNSGHVNFTSAASSTNFFKAVAKMAAAADCEALFSFTMGDTAAQYTANVVLRGNGSWTGNTSPGSGYWLQIQNNLRNVVVVKTVAGVNTTLQTVSNVRPAATTVKTWCRFRVQGTSIQVRIWADGTEEPTTWAVTMSDPDIANGVLQVQAYANGSNANAHDLYLDDITVTDLSSSTQTAYPISDITTASWVKVPSSASSFAAAIGASAPTDDSSYVQSPDNPTGATPITLKFGAVSTPDSRDGHNIQLRMRAVNASSTSVVVSLLQGTTTIASWTETGLTSAFQTFTYNLTNAQASAITDYTDLRISTNPTAS